MLRWTKLHADFLFSSQVQAAHNACLGAWLRLVGMAMMDEKRGVITADRNELPKMDSDLLTCMHHDGLITLQNGTKIIVNGYDPSAEDYFKSQRTKGKMGGRPRNPRVTSGFRKTKSRAKATETETETERRREKIREDPLPLPSPPTGAALRAEVVSDFDRFWESFPKKVGKGAAEKAWQKTHPPLATVLATLDWQRVSIDWVKEGGQYVPNPATYLNQRRWEDAPREIPHVSEKEARGIFAGARWLGRQGDPR